MIALFTEILEEFKDLREKDFIEPPLPFDQRKHVFVAEMSESLKKLFTLWFRARHATRDWTKKFEMAKRAADGSKAAIEVNKAAAKEQALEGTFWYTVSMEHPSSGKSGICMTKGFRVVHDKR